MQALKRAVAEQIAGKAKLTVDAACRALKNPSKSEFGDLAFSCRNLAKSRRMGAAEIAAQLAAELMPAGPVQAWNSAGPYLNVTLKPAALAGAVLDAIAEKGGDYGSSEFGAGQTIVIDYSSPNIGKPIAFHHLRSTVIGNALVRILRAQGYEVVGINHLGDWGTQFGHLLEGLADHTPEQIQQLSIGEIHRSYVAQNEKAKRDPAVAAAARAAFARLERGEPEARARWKACCEVSIRAFERTYERLGMSFEAVTGESFFRDRLAPLLAELTESGVATESEGALIVDLEAEGVRPPCLLRKRDGATLYATRDVAAARHRQEAYGFERALYVTDHGQSLHFRQVFAVLARMGHAWAKNMVHVPFGVVLRWDEESREWVRGKGREGKVVLLEEVLDEAARRASAVIAEKNPGLADRDAVAEQVGAGAVIFNDLKNGREKEVRFRYDDALSFDGDSGPYVQNAHVRAYSILRNAGRAADLNADPSPLIAPAERALLLELGRFPEAATRAAEHLEPHHIARALLELSRVLHQFYHQHRVLQAESKELEAARLRLVDAARVTLRNGLHLLGIAAPEAM